MKLLKLENVATQATKKITTADIADERNRRLQIECYKEWLATHTRRNTINNALREMNEYAESAGKTLLVGERKVNIFAPFRQEHSALWVLTRWQGIALILLALGWCLGLQFFRQQTLIVTMTIITALYLGHLLMTVGLSFFTFRGSTEEEIDEGIVDALRDADLRPGSAINRSRSAMVPRSKNPFTSSRVHCGCSAMWVRYSLHIMPFAHRAKTSEQVSMTQLSSSRSGLDI